MNSNLGVTEILALLDRLKSALQDFAAREEKLETEFRARSSAEARAFEAATSEQAEKQAARLAAAEAQAQAEKQKWQAIHKTNKRMYRERGR